MPAARYRINGGQFGNMPHPVHRGRHVFDRVCDEPGLGHRFIKPVHPWSNGQVERLNRTLKEATVKVYRYASARLRRRRQVRPDW